MGKKGKIMNKKIIKITSIALLGSMFCYTLPVFAYTKEESVYSKLDTEGNVYQVTVSEHLKNMEKENLLKDISDLMDIENVSGKQELEKNNNFLTWKAEGDDIYYQGNTTKELPINCKIKYELNGNDISKEEVVGKNGKVKVTLEFTNNEKREVTINGKNEIIYVPFVVGVGAIIDNENNKNIEITTGKAIDNGNKTIVFGLSMPGLQESLGISKDKIEIPSKVEILIDALEFEMSEIYCFATPKLLEETNLNLDKLNEMYYMVNELKNASTQLVDGSKQLSNGANKLNVGTQELSKELNLTINEYNKTRKELENKEEIEKKIVELVNAEIKKLAPELKILAEQEAASVIKANKQEIEDETTKTAIEYAQIAIKNELKEIENNKEENIQISNQLLKQIEKDILIAIKNIEEKDDVKELENIIKQTVISDVTSNLKDITSKVITNEVEKKKTEILDPTKMLTSKEKEELEKSKNDMAQAMVPGIKAQALTSGKTLTDAQALEIAKINVNKLVVTVSKKTMDGTLDTVAKEAPTMAENTVKNIASKLNTSDALEKAISEYKQKIVTEITNTIGKETLNKVEENIQKEIIEELIKAFENDKTLQIQIEKYGTEAKAKLNKTIDDVAESTARTLANEFSEDIAKQIASNLIKKQLNGELTETQLDKELSKYENLINAKLNETDEKILTLKNALKQLTNGTIELSKGAEQLDNGMSKFDKEGIEKIYQLVNEDVKDLQTRLEKLQDLAEEYNTFTMLNENANGRVKFIMMIDSLSKDNGKEQIILPSEEKEQEEN